jgi:hypothetical protein
MLIGTPLESAVPVAGGRVFQILGSQLREIIIIKIIN